MSSSRSVAITIAVKDVQSSIAALKGLGDAGQAALDRITNASPRATAAFDATGASIVRQSGQMRAAFGQVGFQVQDLVVQLQSGTPALTAFVQQGSQMAGAFGPVGAIVGTVGSAIAIAAGAMIGFRSAADVASEAATALAAAQAAARDTIGGSAKTVDELRERYDALGASMRAVAEIDVEAALRKNATSIASLREQALSSVPDVSFLETAIAASRNTGSAANPTAVRLFEGVTSAASALRNGGPISDFVVSLEQLARSSPEAEGILRDTVDQLAGVARSAADLEADAKRLEAELAVLRKQVPPAGVFPPAGGDGKPAGGSPGIVLRSPAGSSAATLADEARREAEAVARARAEAAQRLQAGQIRIAEAEAETTGKAYAEQWRDSLLAEQAANSAAIEDALATPCTSAASPIAHAFAVFQE